jgi:Ni/Fe-hydrogenase 1 B-type cytochrome subunit
MGISSWANVLSIAVLSFTGFYIGRPFIHATGSEQYIMGWIRFIHFVAAYIFAACFLIRIYWAFVGKEYSRWREFIPVTAKRWGEIFNCIKFYLFLRKEPPLFVGHSALASIAYFLVFILFFVEIITGFAMYSQSHHGTFWNVMGGWLLPFVSAQTIRLYHHLIMWFLIAFYIVHQYIAWYIDITEKSSVLSSMFTGYKTIQEEEVVHEPKVA